MQRTLPFEEFREDSKPIRRRVFRIFKDPLPGGSYVFKAKSFSRRSGLTYRCYVNPATGFISCSCRDFKYRKGRWVPSYPNGPACKHLSRAIRTVQKLAKLAGQGHGLAA